jgi:hypothetical protein
MPIDPSQVQWDPIDPAKIRWDGPSADDDKRKLAQGTSVGDAGVIGAGRSR